MRRLMLSGLLALLLAAGLQADTPTETQTALEQSVIPLRDRVELAQRLGGVDEIAAPPTEMPQWQIGDRQTFWLFNEHEKLSYQVEATLQIIGEHILLWVESDIDVDIATYKRLAQIFDEHIYDTMHNLWGSEDIPGIDGDPRVYGLFAYGQGPGIAAYFSSENTNPVEAVSNSNEHEMFFFNLDTLGLDFPVGPLAGTMAHEFQHMIQANLDRGELSWIDEGFSTFSEIYTGLNYNSEGTALAFLVRPGTQLNTWPEDDPRGPHYGASMLFITYFYDRFGREALHSLGNDPKPGMRALNAVLESLGQGDADSLFADWVLANFLQDTALAEGQYGYKSLPTLVTPGAVSTADTLPFNYSGEVNQYATDYIRIRPLPAVDKLDITLNAPETVRLVPADTPSGQYMWYSNIGDNSDTTLTRRFDLREVTTATLQYKLWYHIETLWDYGYVMLSTDEGQTWTMLRTEHQTDENPHRTAYGPGYTGDSGGWLDESISLDEYAGHEILLRFEMITDDATLQPGMLIDDVHIDAIGYSSDFEGGAEGWEARGWVLIDNVLPQQVWVQAIQRIGEDVEITRWLAPDAAAWTLPLVPGADEVILAISPFAPLTTMPVAYTLTIAGN